MTIMRADRERETKPGNAVGNDLLITFLCQCDSVVLQKDDFETISNHRIIVDHFADSCDQTDDHLGSVVSRSSLQQRDS